MKISAKYTEKDARSFAKAFNSYRMLKFNLKGRIYECTVAAIILFLISLGKHHLVWNLVSSIIIFAIVFLLCPYFGRARHFVLMKWRDKSADKDHECEIELIDDGISFKGASGTSLLFWNQVVTIFNFKKILIIERPAKALSYIPKSAFKDDDELSKFIVEINNKKNR